MKSFVMLLCTMLVICHAAQAQRQCQLIYHSLKDGFDFHFDSKINPLTYRQIENYVYEIAVSDSQIQNEFSLKISTSSAKEILAAAPSWGFSKTRENMAVENHLLAQTNLEQIPKSSALYKMTYEDGSVFYSDIYLNQIQMDHFFIGSWSLGDHLFIAHGLETNSWPNLLKEITQRKNHGRLLQVEKMVSSEIPITTLQSAEKSKVLPLFDANYEGLAARSEQRELRRFAPGVQYLLSFVFSNGVTVSKPIAY